MHSIMPNSLAAAHVIDRWVALQSSSPNYLLLSSLDAARAAAQVRRSSHNVFFRCSVCSMLLLKPCMLFAGGQILGSHRI